MQEPIRVHIDYETFSEADLIKVGGAAYARHPSTRPLMVAWCHKTGDAKQWDAEREPEMPDELREILENRDGKYLCHAQNANFEILVTLLCTRRLYDLDVPDLDDESQREAVRQWLSLWRCSMVMGMGLSLPGSLDAQGKILNVKEVKMSAEGKRLIKLFCMPNRQTKKNPTGLWTYENAPEEYETFLAYNRQDVIAERANFNRIKLYSPMDDTEWRMWHLDQLINLTGLCMDLELAYSAIDVYDRVTDILGGELKKLTGLPNPNSRAQFLPWLESHGFGYDNLRKDTVTKALKDESLSDDVRRALELRQATSKTSIKKFDAIIRAAGGASNDGRLRGAFQYAGAQRTRRWGGRIFQPQNLPRGIFKDPKEMAAAIEFVKSGDIELLDMMYGMENIPDVLSSVIRNAWVAPEGKTLTVADLSSIETVMSWWAAGAERQLDKVRSGIDAYKDFGTKLLEKDYDDITKPERTYCKPVVLGCCYQLGGPGLVAYADGMGIKMTKKEAYKAVDTYRDDNPEIVALWNKLDQGFRKCLATGEPVTINGKFRFTRKKPCVFLELPSGRRLCYVQPKIQKSTIVFEDRETGKKVKKDVMAITYMGVDQMTGKWTRMDTHGGKLMENLIQAIARDVLRDGMLYVEERRDQPLFKDMTIVGHVHDEIITETPPDEVYKDCLIEAMTKASDWCSDAPLGSEAFQSVFYMKD